MNPLKEIDQNDPRALKDISDLQILLWMLGLFLDEFTQVLILYIQQPEEGSHRWSPIELTAYVIAGMGEEQWSVAPAYGDPDFWNQRANLFQMNYIISLGDQIYDETKGLLEIQFWPSSQHQASIRRYISQIYNNSLGLSLDLKGVMQILREMATTPQCDYGELPIEREIREVRSLGMRTSTAN
ncbi:MAG: hypothetical protein Q9182_003003 [Xanthomendoza sp. 2 TL-2023]